MRYVTHMYVSFMAHVSSVMALQRTAKCCDTLQRRIHMCHVPHPYVWHDTTRFNEVLHTYECVIAVTHMNVSLQCIAECCNYLLCCGVLCHATHMDEVRHTCECVVAMCCSMLQCVALCCSVLCHGTRMNEVRHIY